MDANQPHRQVFVKINAPVDEGIASLIEALSSLPAVWTQSSCEGGGGIGCFVMFRYGQTWQEAAPFLVELGGRLSTEECKLSAEWGGGNTLLFTLEAPRAVLPRLCGILRDFGSAYNTAQERNP